MFFNYSINCPNNNKIGTIKTNGKLIFWAALNTLNVSKSNTWILAKKILKSSNINTSDYTLKTKLYSFIVMNKIFNVQNCVTIGKNVYVTNKRLYNQYVCFNNNSFYSFWISKSMNNMYTKINYISNHAIRINNNKNLYFSNYYNNINNTLYMLDPEGSNNECDVVSLLKVKNLKLINDLKKLSIRPIEHNNKQYYVADIGDGIEVGLLRQIVDEMSFECIEYNDIIDYEDKSEVFIYNGYYIKIGGK